MRISMKNDLDLIRAILEEIEGWETASPKVVEIAGWPDHVVNRHVERMANDRLIDTAGMIAGKSPGSGGAVIVRDLTSAGHEFLNAVRSGDVLQRIKDTLKPSELGALSLKKLAGLAGELVEQGVRKKLGLE